MLESELPPIDPEVDEAISQLEPEARERWPGKFGGIWGTGGQDPETDTIFVAFTEGAEEKVATLAEDFPHPEMLSAVEVEKSYDELEAEQWELIRDRERSRAGELQIPDVPPAAYDLNIDVEANEVEVILDEVTPEAEQWFKDRYGEGLGIVEDELSRPTVCDSRPNCDPLRSGLAVRTSEGTVCSLGFAAERPNGSPRLIGSGHCGLGEGNARFHFNPLVPYGNSQLEVVQGRVDAARHSLNNPFTRIARVYVDNTEKARPIKRERDWDAIQPNVHHACVAGAFTPGNCGDITAKGFAPNWIPNGNRFILAEYCSVEGDSCAGVYINERALGIQAGARHECGGQPEDPPEQGVFSSIEYVQNQLGVELIFIPL